jgi:hypothetical protein
MFRNIIVDFKVYVVEAFAQRERIAEVPELEFLPLGRNTNLRFDAGSNLAYLGTRLQIGCGAK